MISAIEPFLQSNVQELVQASIDFIDLVKEKVVHDIFEKDEYYDQFIKAHYRNFEEIDKEELAYMIENITKFPVEKPRTAKKIRTSLSPKISKESDKKSRNESNSSADEKSKTRNNNIKKINKPEKNLKPIINKIPLPKRELIKPNNSQLNTPDSNKRNSRRSEYTSSEKKEEKKEEKNKKMRKFSSEDIVNPSNTEDASGKNSTDIKDLSPEEQFLAEIIKKAVSEKNVNKHLNLFYKKVYTKTNHLDEKFSLFRKNVCLKLLGLAKKAVSKTNITNSYQTVQKES